MSTGETKLREQELGNVGVCNHRQNRTKCLEEGVDGSVVTIGNAKEEEPKILMTGVVSVKILFYFIIVEFF